MSDVVIRAEGLGKEYIIGHETRREHYPALRDVIARGAQNFLRKARDMVHGRPIIEGDEFEEVWALRDVSFEVRRGEVVGIIGRNGAGKSTLLKILSRITDPSEGRVSIKGRVASLLEVGTGFHPELTGRENVFLNGAILGMAREEIKRKLDEIVAFAEVEKFLDTPVKRYSSGMYVRLAFAVAAHMEPEILIVDEVLAVGDAEFQKKCLGRMGNVASEGRTVLFVSHNIAAVKALCGKGLYLDQGRVKRWGSIDDAVTEYLRGGAVTEFNGAIPDDLPRQYSTGEARLRSVHIVDANSHPVQAVLTGEPINILVRWEVFEPIKQGMIEIGIVDLYGRQVTQSLSCDGGTPPFFMGRGRHEIRLRIDDIVFPGCYSLLAGVHKMDGTTIDFVERALDFEVLNTGKGELNHYAWSVRGYLRPAQQWQGPFLIDQPDKGSRLC